MERNDSKIEALLSQALKEGNSLMPSAEMRERIEARLAMEPAALPQRLGQRWWVPALAMSAIAVLALTFLLKMHLPPSEFAESDLEVAANLELYQDYDLISDLDILENMEQLEQAR